MGAQLFDFLFAHGNVVVLATTLLAAIGIVQWRKARVTDLHLAFVEELLAHGLSVADIDVLLRAKAATRTGLLEHFGALSGGAKVLLVIAVMMTVATTLGVVRGAVRSYVFWTHVRQQQADQPPATRNSQALRIALIPEQQIVFLNEKGSDTCRVYVTDDYAVGEQMYAAVSDQDTLDSKSYLCVEPTPVAELQAEGDNGQRYFDVRLQAVCGRGHYTVLVRASNYHKPAQTTFIVRVGLGTKNGRYRVILPQGLPPSEQVANKLHIANVMLTSGKSLAEVLQTIEVSEATYHGWLKKYCIEERPAQTTRRLEEPELPPEASAGRSRTGQSDAGGVTSRKGMPPTQQHP